MVSASYYARMPIRRLPTLLVNQIAAGEVIERPASVVKELVENSIDAGATRIDVAIEQGGVELIRVSDDGFGIPAEELTLAIAPHATSKIAKAEDLDGITTMGFRGEALASIASVSRLRLTSRPRTAGEAALIETEGDLVRPVQPASGPFGTAIEVRNLFFNTPARRKFLKTLATEASRIGDVVLNLAVAHPTIAWKLASDGRVLFDAPSGQSPRQRALEVLGRELEPELLDCEHQSDAIHVWGLAGRPSVARATARHQRLYVNGRMVVDRSVQHAIKEAYRGLIEPTRHPTVVLFIELAPRSVDVNVHPAKSEVRFRDSSLVHQSVLRCLRDALRKADLMPVVQLNPPGLQLARATSDFGAFNPARSSSLAAGSNGASTSARGFDIAEARRELDAMPEPAPIGFPIAEPPPIRPVADVMQVHSSYLVTQDEQGLVIIDQHALHERVMFEMLKERLSRGSLESQRMLLPATFNCARGSAAALDDLQPLLARLGIEAALAGPDAIAVHAFPSFLLDRGVEPEPFMCDLLEKVAGGNLPADLEAALTDVLDMMACKAAVKAGDRMSPDELAELIRMRETVERSSNCPHGRPTSLRLSIRDLDRQFGRS
jgi:DNA mismatch repair protein MutL